jgi:heme A synthase
MPLKVPSTRTRLVGLALMMVSVAICAGALVQSAMAFASGQDCPGPGCDDQIACGQPTQPQATSSRSAGVTPVVVTASVPTASIVVDVRTTTAPPILSNLASRPFAPSAPRSPPSA